MATTALVSTVVMGGLLLAIIALVLRLRGWRHPSVSISAEAPAVASRVNGPVGWSIAFFVVTFAVMGLAMAYVTGGAVAGITPATLGLLVLVTGGAVVVGAGLVAVYGAGRSRGLNAAQAAGLGSVVLATLMVVAIVVQLFVSG